MNDQKIKDLEKIVLTVRNLFNQNKDYAIIKNFVKDASEKYEVSYKTKLELKF